MVSKLLQCFMLSFLFHCHEQTPTEGNSFNHFFQNIKDNEEIDLVILMDR